MILPMGIHNCSNVSQCDPTWLTLHLTSDIIIIIIINNNKTTTTTNNNNNNSNNSNNSSIPNQGVLFIIAEFECHLDPTLVCYPNLLSNYFSQGGAQFPLTQPIQRQETPQNEIAWVTEWGHLAGCLWPRLRPLMDVFGHFQAPAGDFGLGQTYVFFLLAHGGIIFFSQMPDFCHFGYVHLKIVLFVFASGHCEETWKDGQLEILPETMFFPFKKITTWLSAIYMSHATCT